MTLWMAAALVVVAAAALAALIAYARRNGVKAWTIAAIAVLGVVLLAALIYVALTFIFIGAISERAPDEQPTESASEQGMSTVTQESSIITAETPVGTPTTSAIASSAETQAAPTAVPPAETTAIPSAISSTAPPKPDDYDLPVNEVPPLYPDVMGFRDVQYEEMPVFETLNEVTRFVLHNFMNNRFEFDFYLKKEFAVDQGTGFGILDRACETATAYYQFSAYGMYDMFTEERGEDADDKVYAKIKLYYREPEYDVEARAEALEFVMKNPVPDGGFTDFESEKAYARKIHDYIARKITYSPIGYDPESMTGMLKYEALQEAYNVLAEAENTAVCAGYARAFALIAQYAGINTVWVRGNETETQSHAWNVVYPCDGSEAVLVDVTWDDNESVDSPGQEYVSDRHFYIPLSEEYEHTAAEQFDGFLRFVNRS